LEGPAILRAAARTVTDIFGVAPEVGVTGVALATVAAAAAARRATAARLCDKHARSSGLVNSYYPVVRSVHEAVSSLHAWQSTHRQPGTPRTAGGTRPPPQQSLRGPPWLPAGSHDDTRGTLLLSTPRQRHLWVLRSAPTTLARTAAADAARLVGRRKWR